MGFLTTHILDTARGIPARAVSVKLWRIDAADTILLHEVKTNADGRTDTPLLPADDFTVGEYRLDFHLGDYFQAENISSFLTVVPVRFCMDEDRHYHVPLLASPYGYATYRGS